MFRWLVVLYYLIDYRKMKNYKANSYYLLTRIFFLIPLPLFIGFIINQPDTPVKTIYGGLFIIVLFLLFILRLLLKILSVEFKENHMKITYLISRIKLEIPYSEINNWLCIDGQRGYHFNVIKFNSKKFYTTNGIKVDRLVDGDQFIPFLRWMKRKNDRIEFEIIPSDSKLLKEFNKEFKTQ